MIRSNVGSGVFRPKRKSPSGAQTAEIDAEVMRVEAQEGHWLVAARVVSDIE